MKTLKMHLTLKLVELSLPTTNEKKDGELANLLR
jgi:hypothetical protein